MCPAGTININNDLVILSDITINGTSARTNIIDGGAKYRAFRVGTDGNAKINHFTLRNGAGGQGGSTDGGGVLNMAGTVALDFVRITGNGDGGIANQAGGLVSIQHSLIDGNSGGGILNIGGVETTPVTYVAIADSTIFNNTGATGAPGGIANLNRGLLTVLRSTIADNIGGLRATAGGVSIATAGTAQSAGSIVARNLPANCGANKFTDNGYNVEDNDTCGFNFTGNPGLDTKLSSSGGETDVLALLTGSPAIDRLLVSSTNCPAGTLDQRGLYRPQGTACDAGAYEFDQPATYTITGGPSGTVNSGDVQFDFSSNDPSATPVCQLTGPGQSVGYVTCYKSNTQPYSGLANGAYTFSVRDSAFPSSTPATRTFTVAALDTTITGGPTGPTNDTTPTFTFTGVNGAASFQCRVDTAAFAICTTPFTTAPLAVGAHTFEVRALSAAGAPDPTPASRSFTVDLMAPDTTITGGPSGTVASTSATFTYTSTEAGSTFQCQLDGAAFGACPASYTGLAQGSHTFNVRAIDPAGNTDGSPAVRTWTVDTVAPDTTITGGPTGSVSSPSATFTYTSNESPVTFACSLDGGAFAACPANFTGLAQGAHTFQVRANDAADNLDASPASRTWTVDTVAPDTTITGGPTGTVSSTSATFTFTSNESPTTFACSLDGAAFGACPASYTGLGQGAHTLQVRSTDVAGNTDASPASRTWTVDTVGPNTTLTQIATPTNDNTPTFVFSSEAGATFQCRIDTAAFAPCTSPFTSATLTDGSHTFDVRATDAAGNPDATPATQTFEIETGAPNTAVSGGPSGATNDATPTFTFTSDEAGSTFACSVDGAAFAACTSPFTAPALADGAHTFEVRAIDAAGNPDAAPASRAFTVDTTPPAAPDVVSGPDGPTTNSSPEFAFAAADAASTACRLDGPGGAQGEFGPCASPKAFNALAPGDYVFFVRSIDAAGNGQTTQRAFTVTVPQQATPTPTPSATPTPTPTPVPAPVANQSVDITPVSGTVLIKLPGSKVFVKLSHSLIKNGAEVDARQGVVEITRSDGGVAKFYDGIFKLSHAGGYTILTLTEKLTGCPKAKKSSARAAAKKPKSRKLWGDGKGKFRTKGSYSAATVRGTKWLVTDTCTTTVTRVATGVVEVQDFTTKKKILVKKGRTYTARAKRR